MEKAMCGQALPGAGLKTLYNLEGKGEKLQLWPAGQVKAAFLDHDWSESPVAGGNGTQEDSYEKLELRQSTCVAE